MKNNIRLIKKISGLIFTVGTMCSLPAFADPQTHYVYETNSMRKLRLSSLNKEGDEVFMQQNVLNSSIAKINTQQPYCHLYIEKSPIVVKAVWGLLKVVGTPVAKTAKTWGKISNPDIRKLPSYNQDITGKSLKEIFDKDNKANGSEWRDVAEQKTSRRLINRGGFIDSGVFRTAFCQAGYTKAVIMECHNAKGILDVKKQVPSYFEFEAFIPSP